MNKGNKSGTAPIYIAASKKHLMIVEYLLIHGAREEHRERKIKIMKKKMFCQDTFKLCERPGEVLSHVITIEVSVHLYVRAGMKREREREGVKWCR